MTGFEKSERGSENDGVAGMKAISEKGKVWDQGGRQGAGPTVPEEPQRATDRVSKAEPYRKT